MVVSGSHDMVPKRQYIYISGIYCQLKGIICHLPPSIGTKNNHWSWYGAISFSLCFDLLPYHSTHFQGVTILNPTRRLSRRSTQTSSSMQDGWVLSVMRSWPDATTPCCLPGAIVTTKHDEIRPLKNWQMSKYHEISQRSTHHGVVKLVFNKKDGYFGYPNVRFLGCWMAVWFLPKGWKRCWQRVDFDTVIEILWCTQGLCWYPLGN